MKSTDLSKCYNYHDNDYVIIADKVGGGGMVLGPGGVGTDQGGVRHQEPDRCCLNPDWSS